MASRFDRWLARELQRIAATPRLEASLLGGGAAHYLARRAGVVFINRALGYALHMAEAYLIASYLAEGIAVRSFVIASLCQVALGVHWAATELLRSALRDEKSHQRAHAIASAWLSASLGGSVVFAVAGSAASYLLVGARGPAAWYALGCVVRTALDLTIRTYYSSAFAHGRVYRPLAAIWGPQALAFLVLLVASRLVGVWAVPLALWVTLPLGRLLTAYYTRRALAVHRQPAPRISWRAWRQHAFARLPLVVAVAAGVASRLGAIAVVAVAIAPHSAPRAVLLYFVAPAITSCATFAQVFYADCKRLEAPESFLLYRRFLYALSQAAVVVGAVWTAVVYATFALLIPSVLPMRLPSIVPVVLLVLAWSSVNEVALLARRRFFAMGLLGLCLAAAGLAAAQPAVAILALVAAVLVGVGATRRALAPPFELPRALRQRRELAVLSVDLAPLSTHQRQELVYRLPRDAERAVWLRGAELIVVRPVAAPSPAATILTLGGGLVARLTEEHVTPAVLATRSRERSLVAVNAFSAHFPTGIALRVGAPSPLARPLLQEVWADALRVARGGKRRAQRQYDVSVALADGAIAWVFLIPVIVPADERVRWRAALRSGSVDAADAVGRK